MNRSNVIAVLLMALPLQLAAAAEPIVFQGRPLTEVRSMIELPQHIRSRLNMDAPPRAGAADVGKPFNTGDVIYPGLHDRGLVGAAHNGDTWVLAIAENHGWGGVAVLTYVFESSTLARQERSGFWGTADAFAKIVTALGLPLRPRAQLGGVSIDDSQQQVETVLGKPAEIIAHEQTYIGNPAYKPANLMITKELRYPGLSIWLRDGIGVMQINATGSNYCQIGRICPGATVATVKDELQKLGLGGLAPNTNTYSLRHETRSCQADISLNSGTVATIKVSCPL